MIRRGIDFVKREWKMMIRYFFVGSSSFLVKAGMYMLLSRVLQPGGLRDFQNAEAIFISVVYNYTLHRLWTFRGKTPARGSMIRYLSVVGSSIVLDAAIFHVLHTRMGIYDAYVIGIIGIMIAGYGFMSHTFFSFHDDPFRGFKRLIEKIKYAKTKV